MAADAALHFRCGQNFHALSLFLSFFALKVVMNMEGREEEEKKKGLSATPSSTLPWPARMKKQFTKCDI
jgi:hypothetical protein